jgi:hypothetical protein
VFEFGVFSVLRISVNRDVEGIKQPHTGAGHGPGS